MKKIQVQIEFSMFIFHKRMDKINQVYKLFFPNLPPH